MKTTTVSAKGAIVIPKEIREARGLYPGTRVQIVTYGGVTSIVPVPDDPVAALDGMFADDDGVKWTDILLQERRAEFEREEAKIRRWQEPSVSESETQP